MVSEQKIQQSVFPDLPRETPAIDKEGNFSPLWDLGLSSLFQALQQNFKNEGIVFPPLTSAQLATIQALYAVYIGSTYNSLSMNLPDISGQTAFNTTTKFTNQFVIAQDTSGNVTLAEWVPLAVMLTNAGDPNGLQAGILNWLCYDITNKVLYACTTAGNAANAVWTSI